LSEEGKESDRIETHAIGEERCYSNEISNSQKSTTQRLQRAMTIAR